jgi:outer membrane murein-binding lipoprotein Lpp
MMGVKIGTPLILFSILLLSGCSDQYVDNDAQTQIDDLNVTIEEFEERISDLESENDQLLDENSELRQDIDEALFRLDDIESNLE